MYILERDSSGDEGKTLPFEISPNFHSEEFPLNNYDMKMDGKMNKKAEKIEYKKFRKMLS